MLGSNSHLLPAHQEEVNGGDVDADVAAEVLQDVPDGGAGPQRDVGAGTVGQHHAALPGRALPRAH